LSGFSPLQSIRFVAQISMCSTFQVNDSLSVICFRRNHSLGPYFAVREFDTKVIRSSSKNKKTVGKGPSEQAIRASIRQAILNMALRSERASKAEIRMLKQQGILGKRAPSCALLCAEDMLKLLEAFDRPDESNDLRKALEKEGKKPKEEKDLETILLDSDDTVPELKEESSVDPDEAPAPASTTRTSARIKRRKRSSDSPTGLDALLRAVEVSPEADESRSRTNAKTRRITPELTATPSPEEPSPPPSLEVKSSPRQFAVDPIASVGARYVEAIPLPPSLPNDKFQPYLPQQFLPAGAFGAGEMWQEYAIPESEAPAIAAERPEGSMRPLSVCVN